jgi:predicted nucleotidyltransferase
MIGGIERTDRSAAADAGSHGYVRVGGHPSGEPGKQGYNNGQFGHQEGRDVRGIQDAQDIQDYDIVRTKDDLWFYASRSVARSGGVFGYLKYASCDDADKTTVIDGVPAFRVWAKNPLFHSSQVVERSARYKTDTVAEAKFFIPFGSIAKVYRADQATARVMSKTEGLSGVERDCQELLRYAQGLGIPQSSIGLIGSFLLGTVNQGSDIDLIMLTKRGYVSLWNSLALAKPANISFRTPQHWREYELFGTPVGLDQGSFASHNARKLDRGFINGTEFSIIGRNHQVLLDSNDGVLSPSVEMKGRVVDASEAHSLPGRYRVEVKESDTPLPKNISLLNYDREFVNQVHPREDFFARGKLVQSLNPASGLCLVIGPSQRPNGALASLSSLERRLL